MGEDAGELGEGGMEDLLHLARQRSKDAAADHRPPAVQPAARPRGASQLSSDIWGRLEECLMHFWTLVIT